MAKKRIVKNYDALSPEIIEQIKEKYPGGYAESLVSYVDQEGKRVSALPFETDEAYYLVRMTIQEAKKLAKDEEDYDEETPNVAVRSDFADVELDDQYDGGDEEDDMDGHGDEDDHIIVTRRRGDDHDDIADDTEY